MNVKLDDIASPAFLKQLSVEEKYRLAAEIREKIVQTTAKNGGHLSANLGAVELTIALHSVLNTPDDILLFDVGHQCYTHKILTGRVKRFETLRQLDGISGFTRPDESPYDAASSGHASSSISLALGYARARDLRKHNNKIALVIGDGALSGGMCYEALNDAGQSPSQMLIVLNDNEMSISPNVGAMAKHLTHMRGSGIYRNLKQFIREAVNRLPIGGKRAQHVLSKVKDSLKTLLVSDMFFDSLDIEYLGPIDGHDIKEMERVFKRALTYEKPVVVHVITQKGKGYKPAENDPGRFHGTGPFEVSTGKALGTLNGISCGKAACDKLIRLAAEDNSIVCVSAAMLSGTGLEAFANKYPKRCFDVGITEEHAAAMAAGSAMGGLKPYLALYSTFLQRAYDQINIDICLNKAPVCLLIDRAGLNGADGETHQGIYDVSLLNALPGLIIAQPSDIGELNRMIELANSAHMPFAIRYPRELPAGEENYSFEIGKWSIVREEGSVCLVTCGRLLNEALAAVESIRIPMTVVNARFIKPLDEEVLNRISSYSHVFTFEDNVLQGGLGETIRERIGNKTKVYCYGIPDIYIPAGTVAQQLSKYSLDSEGIAKAIRNKLRMHQC